MKKIFYVMALVCAVALTGCNGLTNETPGNTYTQLWPAYNSAVNMYGYINSKGEWAIPAQYSEASSFFSAGYAIVKINGSEAFINTKGEVQKSVSFDSAEEFRYGYSRAELNGKYGILNNQFEFVIQPVYSNLGSMTTDGLVTYKAASEHFGFLNEKGQVLKKDGEPIFYEYADYFDDGYCVVCSNLSTKDDRIPTYALIDTKGETIIREGSYMEMDNLGLGAVAVVNKDKDAYEDNVLKSKPYEWHILNVDGSPLASRIYNYVESYSFDLVAVVGVEVGDDYKYGYIDAFGKEFISTMYDDACRSTDGYAWVLDDKTWKLLDIITGNAVIICQTCTDNLVEEPVCGVHNGLTLICKTIYSNGEESTEYRWVDVAKNNTVYSWNYNKDKHNGDLDTDYWAPARAEKAEFSEYVFLQ